MQEQKKYRSAIYYYTDFQYILHTTYWSLSSNVIGGVLHLYPADSRLLSRLVRRAGMAMRWRPVLSLYRGSHWNLNLVSTQLIFQRLLRIQQTPDSCPDLSVKLEWLCDDITLQGVSLKPGSCKHTTDFSIIATYPVDSRLLSRLVGSAGMAGICNDVQLHILLYRVSHWICDAMVSSYIIGCPTEYWIFWRAHSSFFTEKAPVETCPKSWNGYAMMSS